MAGSTSGSLFDFTNELSGVVDARGNGTPGNDTFKGSNFDDVLYGGEGDDLIEGRGGNDTLFGGPGNDTFLFSTGDGKDTIAADDTQGSNTLKLDVTRDLIYAQKSGNDLILRVGKGNDSVTLQNWYDGSAPRAVTEVELAGGVKLDKGAIDELANSAVPVIGQTLKAGKKKSLTGTDASEKLVGGKKKDKLFGGKGDDTLLGKGKNDRLDGGWGDDLLNGGKGNDKLFGREGDDTLIGGAGKDKLTGGEGKDVFVFNVKPTKANADKITDFQVGEDKIQLKKSIFKKLKEGVLSAENFTSKKGKALDKNDYIVYNTKTGALLYDKDGKGGAAAVEIAKLTNKAKITAADIIIKK